MVNAALRASCPACGGKGRVSFLRSGAWLNEHCPGNNGPVDVDHSFLVHELDNYAGKRKARIEYKYMGERRMDDTGQELHFRAELESTDARWKNLLVLVVDEGQQRRDDMVKFQFAWNANGEYAWHHQKEITIAELGTFIASRIWPDYRITRAVSGVR